MAMAMTNQPMVRFYYLFGFLSLVLLIVLITCAEISIALTYFQLTSEARPGHGISPSETTGSGSACETTVGASAVEDYRWWWTSFSASGSSGIYVFLYSVMCAWVAGLDGLDGDGFLFHVERSKGCGSFMVMCFIMSDNV